MNALEIDDVWKYYGDFPALRSVGLNIAPGSALALLGRNGAGKTTLLRIIAGLSKPSRGTVKIHGSEAREQATRRRIGILGHGIALYDELSAVENLTLFGRLYGLPDARKRADEMLERVGLKPRPRRPGPRVFPRHAPAPGGRPGVSARSRSALAGRAVHRARRPGHRRAPVHDPGHARARPDHRHVHAPAARGSGAGVARRAAPARPDRPYAASARSRCSTIRDGCTGPTETIECSSACFSANVWTIAAKDLHSELRTKEAWNASIAFSIVILVLFSLAFDPSSDQIREFSGGLLWMTYAFAGALVLNRSFAREVQNDCLDVLIASPVSSAALFTGKALANFVQLFAVELVSLPVFGLFYNMPGRLAWRRCCWCWCWEPGRSPSSVRCSARSP